MTAPSNTSSAVGFAELLTIAFIVLKLCGVITWSWWWVLAPLWAPALAAVVVLVAVIGVVALVGAVKR